MGWSELPYNQEDIVRDIIYTAAEVRAHYDNFVVLGIGGSALGPMAVFNALCHFRYNDLDAKKRGVKFYVEDNVDPERMLALLDVIDVEKTMFNVITKSGATSETMSQYLIITDILKRDAVTIGQSISSQRRLKARATSSNSQRKRASRHIIFPTESADVSVNFALSDFFRRRCSASISSDFCAVRRRWTRRATHPIRTRTPL